MYKNMNEANAVSRGRGQTNLKHAFIDLYNSGLKRYILRKMHTFFVELNKSRLVTMRLHF